MSADNRFGINEKMTINVHELKTTVISAMDCNLSTTDNDPTIHRYIDP